MLLVFIFYIVVFFFYLLQIETEAIDCNGYSSLEFLFKVLTKKIIFKN